MKRLLVVLFGVLVFQGSAWALPSGGGLCQKNGDGGKARVLSPADTQQLNKGSAILLQWKDSEDWLGNKVTIELHSRKGKTEQVVKTWSLQINTGSALITRADLRGAKIKKASKKDVRYFFRLKNNAKPKRSIDSGCFTFTKSEKSQRQRRNLKEEIEGLDSTLALLVLIISDLADRLEAVECETTDEGEQWCREAAIGGNVLGDASSGGGSITEHEHPEYAAMDAIGSVYLDIQETKAVLGDTEQNVFELQTQLDDLEGRVGTVEQIMVPGEGTNVLGDASSGGGSITERFPNGTAWQKVVDANEHENESLEACWCDGEADPVGYCTARGWAVGTLQDAYNLQYNRDRARTLALDGIMPRDMDGGRKNIQAVAVWGGAIWCNK